MSSPYLRKGGGGVRRVDSKEEGGGGGVRRVDGKEEGGRRSEESGW